MKVRVDLGTGRIAFLDARGEPILAEKKGGRSSRPRRGAGREDVPRAAGVARERRRVALRPRPAPARPHGHQGLRPRPLAAQRARSSCPSSSRAAATASSGTTRRSRASATCASAEPIPAAQPLRRDGQAGRAHRLLLRRRALRAPGRDARRPRDRHRARRARRSSRTCASTPTLPPEGEVSVRWEGDGRGDRSPATTSSRLFSNGGIKLWVDDRLVIDHWRQGWLPWNDVARVPLEKGRRHRLKLEWSKDQGMETVRSSGRRRRRQRRPRSGPRSATASTTTSSTARSSTAWSPATAASPARRR